MTDDNWFDLRWIGALLSVTPDLSERQHWLFAARCLARARDWSPHPLLPDIVAVCERLADRPDDARLFDALQSLAVDMLPDGWLDEGLEDLRRLAAAVDILTETETDLPRFAMHLEGSLDGWGNSELGEELFQADILRDLVPPPSALPWDDAWGSGTALLLSALAESRAEFSLLPVFADALEESGCGCAARLAHLRAESHAHGPGCWALAPRRAAGGHRRGAGRGEMPTIRS